MKAFDIVAVGEVLIDLTPAGISNNGAALFARNAGGAPANVLTMDGKLGGRDAFIGRVGNDGFGTFLVGALASNGLDVSGVSVDDEVPTSLAVVQLDEKGDRSFSFYRKPGADIMLKAQDIPQSIISDCTIFHFGSVSLTDEPARSATLWAANAAKQSGAMISYDPNYRPLLWHDTALAKQIMRKGLEIADIVKVSDNELELMTDTDDVALASERLLAKGAAVVLISCGAQGSYVRTANAFVFAPAFKVSVVDTTGAGDAFMGAVLNRLKGYNLQQLSALSVQQWQYILTFGNAAGGITATGSGAIASMPDIDAINALLNK